jgi:hypothetical protein
MTNESTEPKVCTCKDCEAGKCACGDACPCSSTGVCTCEAR